MLALLSIYQPLKTSTFLEQISNVVCGYWLFFLCHFGLFIATLIVIDESFQDYSWIQDFEADFPQKVSLKILNKGDNSCFSDLFSVYLKAIDHLNLKLWIFREHIASFKIWVSKVQDFGNFELSLMDCEISYDGYTVK